MIWDRMLNAELAEPAIREVHLNFATDQPLRADREDISHDQHPDHQFRIDRRPTHGRIMRCKFAAEPGKIESSIDLPYQMIFRDCVIELKLVEKLRLFALQPTHHGLPPPRFASARWNHGSPQASTDFCNKIGTFRKSRARYMCCVWRSSCGSSGYHKVRSWVPSRRRLQLGPDSPSLKLRARVLALCGRRSG